MGSAPLSPLLSLGSHRNDQEVIKKNVKFYMEVGTLKAGRRSGVGNLGKNLRAARKKLDLTQDKLPAQRRSSRGGQQNRVRQARPQVAGCGGRARIELLPRSATAAFIACARERPELTELVGYALNHRIRVQALTL
jgi:hypothetical protein